MAGAKRKYESPVPEIDEGWWESVLAEESRSSGPPPLRAAATKPEVRKEAKESAQEKTLSVDWTQARDLYLSDQVVELVVIGHNRGGLLVEGAGLQGFVPFSHVVELAGKSDFSDRTVVLESYVGRPLRLKVIECTPEDERVVFSERAAQSEPGKRTELFHELKPGQAVRGLVTNITDFGVFVDLGGVEGLIHISELSWGRVMHPSQIAKLGEPITVQVLDLVPERCRVALSLKRLLPNPWENASADFPQGSTQRATVTKVLSYGAFARIQAGVEGLVHISEIPQAADGKPLKEILSAGQEVQVRILHLDAAHQRMGLSMRLE
jgi:small subunit ribosomal protein S1